LCEQWAGNGTGTREQVFIVITLLTWKIDMIPLLIRAVAQIGITAIQKKKADNEKKKLQSAVGQGLNARSQSLQTGIKGFNAAQLPKQAAAAANMKKGTPLAQQLAEHSKTGFPSLKNIIDERDRLKKDSEAREKIDKTAAELAKIKDRMVASTDKEGKISAKDFIALTKCEQEMSKAKITLRRLVPGQGKGDSGGMPGPADVRSLRRAAIGAKETVEQANADMEAIKKRMLDSTRKNGKIAFEDYQALTECEQTIKVAQCVLNRVAPDQGIGVPGSMPRAGGSGGKLGSMGW
jgi:hypothetical protein